MPNTDDSPPKPGASHTPNPPAPANPRPAGVTHTIRAALKKIPAWAIALAVLGGLFVAMLLPAFSAAKAHAQRIACSNNLKSVGLAFRVWSTDQNDTFVFNLSTNHGGTLEWCLRAADGLDLNSWMHFQALSNELSTPKILCCPSDSARPALDFSHLKPANVTYRIHSGTNVTETNTTCALIICPVHHNVVFCDGSVQGVSKAHMRELLNPPQPAPSPQ